MINKAWKNVNCFLKRIELNEDNSLEQVDRPKYRIELLIDEW